MINTLLSKQHFELSEKLMKSEKTDQVVLFLRSHNIFANNEAFLIRDTFIHSWRIF